MLSRPAHPYTRGLIDCLPELGSSLREGRAELAEIEGVVPSIFELASGCAFRERCPHAMAICAERVPPMFAIDAAPHDARPAVRAEAAGVMRADRARQARAATPIAPVVASAAESGEPAAHGSTVPGVSATAAGTAAAAMLVAAGATGPRPELHGAACWLHAAGTEPRS